MEINDILKKKPFTRGLSNLVIDGSEASPNTMEVVSLPMLSYKTVSQDRFLKELDPASHDIHKDDNVPTIVAKLSDGGYYEIKDIRMALAYQQMIVEKQTLYLCGKQTQFTLLNPKPTKEEKSLFANAKAAWLKKNMEQVKTEAIKKQKSVGDAAVIHYISSSNECRAKVVSYMDGYILLPHYDTNGELEVFGLYYSYGANTERLDVYDRATMKSYVRSTDAENAEWAEISSVPHGYKKVPVSYIRGDVAWNKAQSLIEVKEILYNIFTVIMKRHGWGMLYIKGTVDTKMKKIAGSVILQDTSPEGTGSAEYKAPPTPEGMQNLLTDLHKQIQMMSNTVFLLPEDVKVGGDISGAAMKTMMSSAYEKALLDTVYYDPFMDSMIDLFIYGYGIEEAKSAQYGRLSIKGDFDIWFPQSDSDVVNNIVALKGGKAISTQTATEMSPYSAHDEIERIREEIEDEKLFQNELAKYNGVSLTKAKSTGFNKQIEPPTK